MWAKSGRELFYTTNAGEIMSVPVQLTPSFDYGKAVTLFNWPTINVPGLARTYDVSRDGRKFLMIKEAPAAGNERSPSTSQIVIVVNWSEELRRLAAK